MTCQLSVYNRGKKLFVKFIHTSSFKKWIDLFREIMLKDVVSRREFDLDRIVDQDSKKFEDAMIWAVVWKANGKIVVNSYDVLNPQIETLDCMLNDYTEMTNMQKMKDLMTDRECTTLVQLVSKNQSASKQSREWLDFHTAVFPCSSESTDSVLSKLTLNPAPTLKPMENIADGSFGMVVKAKNTSTGKQFAVKYQKNILNKLCDNLVCQSSSSAACEIEQKMCPVQNAVHEIFVNMKAIAPFVLRSNSNVFNLMLGSWLCEGPVDPVNTGKFCDSKDAVTRFYSAFELLSNKVVMMEFVLDTSVNEDTKFEDVNDVLTTLFKGLSDIQRKDLKYNHHDLHDGNILIEKIDGEIYPIIIDQGCATLYFPLSDTLAWSGDVAKFTGFCQMVGLPAKCYMPCDDILLVLGQVVINLIGTKKYDNIVYALLDLINGLYRCEKSKVISRSIAYCYEKERKPRFQKLIDFISKSHRATASYMDWCMDGVDYTDVVQAIRTKWRPLYEHRKSLNQPFLWSSYHT